MKRYETMLLNFQKPDARGFSFEAPVSLSCLNPNVTVNFTGISVGRVLKATQDDKYLIAILEWPAVMPNDYVPTVAFTTPAGVYDVEQGGPKGGMWRGVSVTEVSLVKRDGAELPPDFYMREITLENPY